MAYATKHPKYQETRCLKCSRLTGYVLQKYPARNLYKCIVCYIEGIKEVQT